MLARSPIDLGLLIRDQRRKLGLDQRELAERVGVSRQWIVEVEAGKPRAEVGLVLRTLATLHLDVDVRPHVESTGGAGSVPTGVTLDYLIDHARKRKK